MDAVSEVKSRINIEDVVSEYVQLKRAGRNFKGLSPWTNEKTASFIVSPEKQIWHDFSSGKGGDVFSFVMEMEALDFRGALEHLARKAGVDLEQFNSGRGRTDSKLKSRAAEALELAAKFYQAQLKANQPALSYLIKNRGFKKETILTWRLGYSPAVGALTDFLTKKGFTTDEMRRAGLVVNRRAGTGDMFRGRIMVPLSDSRGTVVGFTARLLADEPDAPKYINTPQTLLYDKGRQVYGLYLAKEAIRKAGYVVVVEGNMDVIASWQAGVQNVVASAGTAMTQNHLRELKRFTGDIRLSFDADQAGVAATERVIPLSQGVGVELRIITIEDAKDPDELVRKDVKAWRQVIDKAVYAPDWLINQYKSQLDLSSAAGKKALADALLPTIRRLNDPIEQEHYLKEIAKLTESSLETVRKRMSGGADQPAIRLKKGKITPGQTDRAAVEYQRLQDHLLAMTLSRPKLRHLLKGLESEYFTDGTSRQMFEFLKQNPKFNGDPKLAKQLQGIADYVKILLLQYEEIYADLDEADLAEQAAGLRSRLIDRYVKLQKHRLAAQMSQTTNEQELQKLLRKANKLNELIRK